MSRNYTTDDNGDIAVPVPNNPYRRAEALPAIIGEGMVRAMARELADDLISEARTVHGPVVWVTGNAYMPPMRSFPAAERVNNAANNDDGELFAWFCETVENYLTAAKVALECPDWDNALYVVDLARWEYREDADGDDLNDEWVPVTPATDDSGE